MSMKCILIHKRIAVAELELDDATGTNSAYMGSGQFFYNLFSDNMGDVLFGKTKRGKDFDFMSPDNSSDGFLKKGGRS